MKISKANFMALALAVGIGGALANTSFVKNNNSGKKPPVYNWQQVNSDGSVNTSGYYLANATYPQAVAWFGCSGTGGQCVRAIDHEDGTWLQPGIYIDKAGAQ